MDIQLQPSLYLLALRLCCFCMAALAILTNNLGWVCQLLLCTFLLLQVKSTLEGKDPVCSLQFSTDANIKTQACGQKLILEMRSRRRIELTLTGFYCLWWMQILYLTTARSTVIVIVLPDSCSYTERRLLRKFLGQ